MSKNVYLDYAATTPIDKQVLKSMLPFLKQNYGNASSLHTPGRKANQAVEKSRATIAHATGMQNKEVIFTSGATESNNLAIKGTFQALNAKFNSLKKLHFITSNIEHHCVLDSFAYLKKKYPKNVEITYLPVNEKGLINPDILAKALKKNTVLISIMMINNEIGTAQPLKKIAQIIKKQKKARSQDQNPMPIYFHSDATQAPSYFSIQCSAYGLDLLTINAHKIYGPKGVGALVIKKGVLIHAINHGGGHEFRKRSGTLNVPGIVGMGKAIELAEKNRDKNIEKITKLRDYFLNQISQKLKRIKVNGSLKKRTPNNINISFLGVEGESLLLLLDKKGIYVSTGSACSSNSLQASHVQLALHNNHLRAHSSIRFTLGKFLLKSDLDYAVQEISKAVNRLRKISQGINQKSECKKS
ncbi:MAG: aminotransferase class V-fold PLP-dependent enzyme [Candidatus Moranbacteria bacterium]|nr:aminotransferase class V-fold PLP-dependent enzyme [Candidatus Moranbacteria bacterium]